jgi:general secretion pathway protein I
MMRSREAGFSLLEVLVAFAIASLALTTLVQVYSGSANAARRGAEMLGALEVAENRLSELAAVTLAPGVLGPAEESGFLWQVDVVAAPEEKGEAEDRPPGMPQLLLVTVTVRPADGSAPLVTLATARHGPRAGRAEER